MDGTAHYSDVHGALAAALPWLDRVRSAGLQQLERSGFPGRKDEDWKYTNAAKVLATAYTPQAPGALAELPAGALASGPTLVWVDGRISESLSRLDALPEGISVTGLTEGRVGDVLGEARGFDALNSAFLTDGAAIEIAAKADIAEPIHLVHVSTGGERLNALRIDIRTGANSRATVVEHWLGDGASLTTAVTELDLGPNSALTHIRIQDEDRDQGHHVGTVVSRQARDSRLRSWVITLGGAISRVDLRAELAGVGSEVELHGLYLLRGSQHADHHTHVDHAVPHTVSREQYKGILDDTSRGVFTGRVVVRRDAQKIDSTQANHNLVLSDTAVANTRPQLEIFADDVKCAHGATIGRLDPEASFYLQSRGLSRSEARGLLTIAFANEVLEGIDDEGLREGLADRVRGWLVAP